MLFLKAFGLCLISVGVLDAVWLGLSAGPIYAPMMGALMRSDTQVVPAAGFYLIYTLGLARLVVWPAVKSGSKKGLWVNALTYGLAAYGTYDLTAWAVIAGWPWPLSLIDMAWGAVASLVTTYFVTFVLKSNATGN